MLFICPRLVFQPAMKQGTLSREIFLGGKKEKKYILLLPFHQRPGFISCKQLKFWGTKALSHLAEITKACFWLTVTGHDLQPLPMFQGFFSSPCLPQSKLNYKLEKSCSEILPSWGWMSVTSVRTHFIRIPQLLVSCQSQLHQRLQKYWAAQVGGQENRWPTIPSTKFMPWLLTAEAVLAVSIGVISGFLWPKRLKKFKMSLYSKSNITLSWQQPAHWLGFSVDFFFPLSMNSNHIRLCHISIICYISDLLALNLI